VKHVTISRRFVARYCYVAFRWLDCNPHEGAIYSGGRLGGAAAVVRVSLAPLLGSFTQLAHSQLLLSLKFKQYEYANDSIHDSARHMIPSQFFKKTSPAAQQFSCRNIPSSSEHSVMSTTSFRASRIQSCQQHPAVRRASSITANVSLRAAYSTFEDSVASMKHVTISRRFVARYCQVAFRWLDCNPH